MSAPVKVEVTLTLTVGVDSDAMTDEMSEEIGAEVEYRVGDGSSRWGGEEPDGYLVYDPEVTDFKVVGA